LGHHLQGRLLRAVQHHQSLHHQLPQDPQRICGLREFSLQGLKASGHAGRRRVALWHQVQLCRIPSAQSLHQSRAFSAWINQIVPRYSVQASLPVIIQIA
jgi:hypothetical protein